MRLNSLLLWPIIFSLLASLHGDLLAAAEPHPPDLTQGGHKDNVHDWTLGPTGARGWIFGHRLETTEARQILVTAIDKGSPADGVLEVDDVILGVGGKLFESDARIAFGRAITEAETEPGHGALRLVRWRKGKQDECTVRLRVMGSYGDSAPWNCDKSRRILEQAHLYLAQHGLGKGFVAPVNGLAVLATGRPDLLGKVKALAHEIGRPDVRLSPRDGLVCWGWGYNGIFLGEYYLATGDDYVLPAVRKYALAIANGQSAVGTWGHDTSEPWMNGRLGGYGAINQAGQGCWLAMVLAQKCGIEDEVVKKAVARSQAFFDFYVDKGSIPYGDHPPWTETHDNNGKNSMAAVALDLLADRRGTRYFARMATASYDEREFGHTGNYFSYLWGPLGVARVGPEAAAAYMKEQRWYFDLARRWDGGFTYQGGAGEGDSYQKWDMTGVFMLGYALPLNKLCITGRGASSENFLAGDEVRAVIEDGRGFAYTRMKNCYDGKSEPELLKGLGSWSPIVRTRAARALAHSGGDVVPGLMSLLGSAGARGDLPAQYGACQALEYQKERAAPAVDQLIGLLGAPDPWLQIRAAYALSGIGKSARKAAPALLKLALVEGRHDPRAMTRRYLCMALFMRDRIDDAPPHGLLADSLADVDRELLCPAVKQMLLLDDGLARTELASIFDKLTAEDLERLWPDIVRAVEVQAPSGEMFADGVRLAGLRLLGKHHIREGMQVCLEYARNQNVWGNQDRMTEILKVLKSYGAEAQTMLPELRALETTCREEKALSPDNHATLVAAVENAIGFVEAAEGHPQLRSIAPLLKEANGK